MPQLPATSFFRLHNIVCLLLITIENVVHTINYIGMRPHNTSQCQLCAAWRPGSRSRTCRRSLRCSGAARPRCTSPGPDPSSPTWTGSPPRRSTSRGDPATSWTPPPDTGSRRGPTPRGWRGAATEYFWLCENIFMFVYLFKDFPAAQDWQTDKNSLPGAPPHNPPRNQSGKVLSLIRAKFIGWLRSEGELEVKTFKPGGGESKKLSVDDVGGG